MMDSKHKNTAAIYLGAAIGWIIIAILAGLVTMSFWNFGLQGIVAACGGEIDSLALPEALWINLVVLVAKTPFYRVEKV